jgi:mono/diheme cytochrome c family protein
VPNEGDDSPFAGGYQAFSNWCIDCHKYEGEGGADLAGPDFTGYGSPEWVRAMLLAPDSAERYGKRSTMPSFAEKLTETEVDLLVAWLTSRADAPHGNALARRSASHAMQTARPDRGSETVR